MTLLVTLTLICLVAPAAAAYQPSGIYIAGQADFVDHALRDAHGIPLVNYGRYLGIQYNPYTVANDGIGYFNSWLLSHQGWKLARAVNDANWLISTQQPDGRWLYRFRLADYGLSPGWPSAIAQGGALSLLTRMWDVTHDQRYLRAARLALLPFSRPVSSGGILADWTCNRLQTLPCGTGWGHRWFYEEAPSNPPSLILNGFEVALLGLYDMSKTDPGSAAALLYRRGLSTLVALIRLYDGGEGRSIYALDEMTGLRQHWLGPLPRDSGYHHVNLMFLQVINSLSPRPQLERYVRLWGPAGTDSPRTDTSTGLRVRI